MSKILATCLMMASQTYSVPPAVMVGIMQVEGGRVGQQVLNKNGTYDLGPMQINTLWVPKLAKHWGVSEEVAKRWIRDDACTNMGVSAWILRKHLNETDSLPKAIAYYHSRTPHLGHAYKNRVVKAMRKNGLIRNPTPVTGPAPSISVQKHQMQAKVTGGFQGLNNDTIAQNDVQVTHAQSLGANPAQSANIAQDVTQKTVNSGIRVGLQHISQ